MSNTVEPSHRGAFGAKILAVAGAVLVAAFMATSLFSSPAQASSGLAGQASTCPAAIANAYNTFTTIAGCTTTTTVASSSFALTVSYSSGTVTWKACGSQSLSGTTVQLYIDGQAVTTDGGNATVGSNGCTDPDVAECLAPGTHNATAVDGPNQASKSFTVSSSGCANPEVGSGGLGAGGSGTPAKSGSLAFTGSNIAVVLVAAALLIGLGLGIVRVARQRRNLV